MFDFLFIWLNLFFNWESFLYLTEIYTHCLLLRTVVLINRICMPEQTPVFIFYTLNAKLWKTDVSSQLSLKAENTSVYMCHINLV